MDEVMHRGPCGLRMYRRTGERKGMVWVMEWSYPRKRKAKGEGKSKADCIRQAMRVIEAWAAEINYWASAVDEDRTTPKKGEGE